MYINVNPNQFGFKRKHGTDQCIYVLKTIVDLYCMFPGCWYSIKSFDRDNHRTLFKGCSRICIASIIILV